MLKHNLNMPYKRLLPIGLGFAIGLVILAVFIKPSAQNSVVFLDMQRALSKPAILLGKTKMDKKAQEKIMKAYAASLSGVIREYGQAHGLTIVSANLLGSFGGADITDEIISIALKKVGRHE